jgi:RNA polymerase sigma factor (sigma-70 family)
MSASTTRNQRIENLSRRIRRVSRYQQFQTSILDHDDVEQEMALRVLEHAESHPNYLEQTDAYILKDAYYAGLQSRRKEVVYMSYVHEEDDITAVRPSDDDMDMEVFELIPAEEITPEEAAIMREEIKKIEKAVANLSPTNQIIVKMLLEGYSESEIADELKISRPAVSQHKQTIIRQMNFLSA